MHYSKNKIVKIVSFDTRSNSGSDIQNYSNYFRTSFTHDGFVYCNIYINVNGYYEKEIPNRRDQIRSKVNLYHQGKRFLISSSIYHRRFHHLTESICSLENSNTFFLTIFRTQSTGIQEQTNKQMIYGLPEFVYM